MAMAMQQQHADAVADATLVQALVRRQLGLPPPPLPFAVHDADVFTSHPAQLYDAFKEEAEEDGCVYFFSPCRPRCRRPPSSRRGGHWKVGAGTVPVYGNHAGGSVGVRMNLVYFDDGVGKTLWAMDEYTARRSQQQRRRQGPDGGGGAAGLRLCRVYRRDRMEQARLIGQLSRMCMQN